MILEVLFWLSLTFVVYTYFGYPILLYIWSILKPAQKPLTEHRTPLVSVVIAAKNEEANIKTRLDNIFQQEYPQNNLEIIVVSDGSTDRTNVIVKEIVKSDTTDTNKEKAKISLIELPQSLGKPNALNQGIAAATGEFVVFADARQKFDSKAIRNLVANFAGAKVGCVSGELVFYESEDSTIKSEMGLYWKLEKTIRKLESKIGSVAGATGAIYAIRKSLYVNLPEETLLDDVLTPMNIVMQGYRNIFESRAQAFDFVSKDIKQEWSRKVRTLAGNWQFITIRPELLLPGKNPIWFRFISHKMFRLLVPFFLIVLFFSSCFIDNRFYSIAAITQSGFYLIALLGHQFVSLRSNKLINIIYFFSVLNGAALKGFWIWIKGDCSKV